MRKNEKLDSVKYLHYADGKLSQENVSMMSLN